MISASLRYIILVLALVGCAVGKKCTQDHPKVGYVAKLKTLQHEVSGDVTIVDDCSFEATLTWDGEGPDVFWYGADTKENLPGGIIMDALEGVHSNTSVMVDLPEDVTWDDIDVISVWCRLFGVNFGYGTFMPKDDC